MANNNLKKDFKYLFSKWWFWILILVVLVIAWLTSNFFEFIFTGKDTFYSTFQK